MLRPILKYPNPELKKKSSPVESVNEEVRKLISDMFETMYTASGVGLAAPQLGIQQNIITIDVGRMENEQTRPDPIALINPIIESQEGKITWEEGCLSVPELIVSVQRAAKVVVKALNPDGKEIKLLGEQLLAVALQHEIDHLEGILLVDRLSRLKRDLYRKKLEKRDSTSEIVEATKITGRKPYMG